MSVIAATLIAPPETNKYTSNDYNYRGHLPVNVNLNNYTEGIVNKKNSNYVKTNDTYNTTNQLKSKTNLTSRVLILNSDKIKKIKYWAYKNISFYYILI